MKPKQTSLKAFPFLHSCLAGQLSVGNLCSSDEKDHLDVANTSIGLNVARHIRVRISRRNILTLKVLQETSTTTARERTGAAKSIAHALVAKVLVAHSGVGVDGEDCAAAAGALDGLRNVLEGVAFGDDVAAVGQLEGVVGVGVPVVVDGVE